MRLIEEENWMKNKLCRALACLGLTALLACQGLSAMAASYGEANITTQTTLKEIRENPSIAGSGIFTYGNADFDCTLLRDLFQNESLSDYVGSWQAEDCAEGLNMVINNYNAGIQVTYPVYSAEEIAADPSKGDAELYYFPAEEPGAKYAIILGGNIASTSGELREGVASVPQLHEMGYAVFVLRYRIWTVMSNNAPLEDLGNAVRYITAHADQLGVQPENYALIGYSSGGQIAGVFSSKKYGYPNYDVPRPGALIMGYAVVNMNAIKPVYHVLYDTSDYGWKYYWSNLKDVLDEDYPPVYYWRGDNDKMLEPSWMPGGYHELEQALQAYNIPHKKVSYANAPHAICTGRGTDAEGWLADAAAFWEEQTAQK